MSLALIRGSARRLAAMLVVVSLWSLPHVAQSDDQCRPLAAEEHDESRHVFTRDAAPAAHEEHCTVCHWIRSLKPDLSQRAFVVSNGGAGAALDVTADPPRRAGSVSHLPARAPPSLS